ncbi:c-type cytochrome [Pollutimonas thiosulfatoxidans]|uniref:Cytochrome C n=1 Tax=Pollutimonas thiosulfatoxidans TaxID=2028345 RepID=A0A410GCX2_9BURK|nr:cytochrome c [Pollutimonas thiosulfatoxidans]MBF6616839.1 cytochrome c [Candidimonas sp.]NYT43876.1 cytochrome c [Alcaligenaceae bacterium]QAA94147.1 cytochrome C [Pollutimonas thiosulfatoxidans]
MKGSSISPASVFLALGLAGLAVPSWSADIEAGRAKSMQCAVCHGAQGMATAPDAPNLAGQNEMYLVKALKDFKSKAREHEVMNLMAAGLSDDDMADLAAYYQSVEIQLKTAP